MKYPAKNFGPTLRSLGENELVRRIARWSGSGASAFVVPASAGNPSTIPSARRPPWADCEVVVAIGDDTALVRAGGAGARGKTATNKPAGTGRSTGARTTSERSPLLALTTDLLIEGVHFLPDHPPRLLGAKALEVNLSDLAAVGAWPAWYLVSLGAPPDTPEAWVRSLYAGMRSVGARYGCLCIGGDCVRADRLTINIVAGGLCEPGVAPPLRSRARVGQALYVTGTLGDSGAGLRLLRAEVGQAFQPACSAQVGEPTGAAQAGKPAPLFSPSSLALHPSSFALRPSSFLIARHQHPTARVEAGVAIARLCPDAAMMDLSDGLATDLPRLAEASRCGFDVRLDGLPLSPALRRFALRAEEPKGKEGETKRKDEARHAAPSSTSYAAATAFALSGGEDYELLFTTARPESEWLDAVSHAAGGRPVRISRIGEVTERAGAVRFLDALGREVTPPVRPFEHY